MSEVYFDELDGYYRYTDGDDLVHEHRLNLLIDHEPAEVFDPDNNAHHKNKLKLDNRPKNLELLNESEHHVIHSDEEWVGEDGEPQLCYPYYDVTDFGVADD